MCECVCACLCVCVQGSLHAQPCRQPRCYSRYFSRSGQALRRGGCHSAGPHQPTRSPAGAQGRGGPGGCAREGVGTLLAGVLGGTASLQSLEGQSRALQQGGGSICRTWPWPGAPQAGVSGCPSPAQLEVAAGPAVPRGPVGFSAPGGAQTPPSRDVGRWHGGRRTHWVLGAGVTPMSPPAT